MQIRVMTIEDVPSALAFWQTCDGLGLGDSDTPEALVGFLTRNAGTSWVAVSNDELVGAVLAGHDGRRGFLYHVAVRSECRRRGLGRQLVHRALTSLRGAGILKCHLMLFRSNRDGGEFWKSLGFRLREDLDVCSLSLL